MDLKTLGKAIAEKASINRKRRKKTAKSYVSLFIVMTLAIGGTTAWLTAKDGISITSPVLEMKSSSGMQDDQLQSYQTEIAISNFRMEEASSVDGRNIYFPSSFKNNASDAVNATVEYRWDFPNSSDNGRIINFDYGSTNTNTNMDAQTKALSFREGNAGDKMVRYAYADTTISSSGALTKVWLKGYKVTIGNSVYQDHINLTYNGNTPVEQVFPADYTCPVRIAIIDDSGHTPKVFDPSAKLSSYVNNTNAVYKIDTEGKAETETTRLDSFSSYYYGTDNPLFTIEPGKTISLTVVAWLEGTHPRAKEYVGKELTFELEIETNVNEMEEIYLHDWTIGDEHNSVNASQVRTAHTWNGGNWLSGNVNIVLSYYDNVAESWKTSVMTDAGTDSNGCKQYKTAIPKYVSTQISFYRLSTHGDDVFDGTIFNSWHTYVGVRNNLHPNLKGNSNWEILGNLAETRLIGSTNSKYVHYYALRGNGYSTVAHNDSQRYEKWLSPCIGYWGTANGPVSRN